jgi:hypothetical protein
MKDVADWIREINENGKGLTDWEANFMESVTDQFERTGEVSPKQREHIERIYATKTP